MTDGMAFLSGDRMSCSMKSMEGREEGEGVTWGC